MTDEIEKLKVIRDTTGEATVKLGEINGQIKEAERQLETAQVQLKNAEVNLALKVQEVKDFEVQIEKDKIAHDKTLTVCKGEIVELDKKKTEKKKQLDDFDTEYTAKLEALNKQIKAIDGKTSKLEEDTKKNEASKLASDTAVLEATKACEKLRAQELVTLGVSKDTAAQLETFTKFRDDLAKREDKLPQREIALNLREEELNKKADEIETNNRNLTIRQEKNVIDEKNLDLKREVDIRNTEVLLKFLQEAKLLGFREEKLEKVEPIKEPEKPVKGIVKGITKTKKGRK